MLISPSIQLFKYFCSDLRLLSAHSISLLLQSNEWNFIHEIILIVKVVSYLSNDKRTGQRLMEKNFLVNESRSIEREENFSWIRFNWLEQLRLSYYPIESLIGNQYSKLFCYQIDSDFDSSSELTTQTTTFVQHLSIFLKTFIKSLSTHSNQLISASWLFDSPPTVPTLSRHCLIARWFYIITASCSYPSQHHVLRPRAVSLAVPPMTLDRKAKNTFNMQMCSH